MDDSTKWIQGIGVIKGMEESGKRVHKERVLNCPRCNSSNTKFCYYNNYSLSQPRYFCKTCRRYWTEGGSLRNVPVGGGSRKNKRSSSSTSSSYKLHDHHHQAPSSSSQSSKGLSSFIPMPSSVSNPQDFKPTLNFCLDGVESGYVNMQEVQGNNGARLLFPMEDLKQVSSLGDGFEQIRGQGDASSGYWNVMMGGGYWH